MVLLFALGTCFIFCLIRTFASNLESPNRRFLSSETSNDRSANSTSFRILYTVTSIREYDDGKRATTKGFDRFTNILLPAVQESIQSMSRLYNVDLCVITAYKLSDTRRLQLQSILPASSRLLVWDEATPLGYNKEKRKRQIGFVTRALARQHRYVIKDHFMNYNMFVNFEDDMIVKGAHVEEYLRLAQEIDKLYTSAPMHLDHNKETTPLDRLKNYSGRMTKFQLARMIPGFMRVEVVEDHWVSKSRDTYKMIPTTTSWVFDLDDAFTSKNISQLDPSVCCHLDHATSRTELSSPRIDQLYFWETSLDALGVRKMPNGDWVLLQAGNDDKIYSNLDTIIGDYWSGCDYHFDNQWKRDQLWTGERPPRTPGQYINNMGGWMATREQIWGWHTKYCMGGFLPPYNSPRFPGDGLDKETVEFWSGGLQLVGPRACNLQRIIPLDPKYFDKHLLFHSSNNKHKSALVKPFFSPDSIDVFWARLNTVKTNALKNLESGGCKNVAI